jgi:hypothetical protein
MIGNVSEIITKHFLSILSMQAACFAASFELINVKKSGH